MMRAFIRSTHLLADFINDLAKQPTPLGRSGGIETFKFKDWSPEIEASLAEFESVRQPEFNVGDIVETQEEADRLPEGAVIVNHDEGYVSRVYQAMPSKYEGMNYFLTIGEECSESAEDIDLPATIVWMYPTTSQDGAR